MWQTQIFALEPRSHEAFNRLKEAFSMAPILRPSGSSNAFCGQSGRLYYPWCCGCAVSTPLWASPPHPCTFFYQKLTSAEQNYDIGNRELLAIKFSLRRVASLAGGSIIPIQVITDHKNLQYLRDAKRLNPRQACWALFFIWFNFTITYRLGGQNHKADALSRFHAPDQPSDPDPILPPALIVSPIQWDITERILDATHTEPAPQGGPEGKTYVPSSLRLSLWLSSWGVPGSGRPGSQRTLSLLQARYWWPSMTRGVIRYIHSCSVLCPVQDANAISPLESWFHCLFHIDFHHNHPDRPAPRGCGRPRCHISASGAAPGGGGNVRESQSLQSPQPTQSPQSSAPTFTRSQSPDY